MEQDLLDKAMKRLLDMKNEEREDFLQDLELKVSQLCVDVDQELKTLTSLSDTNDDFNLEIENHTDWLRHVQVKGNKVNSAIDFLEDHLVDEKLRTSELTDILAEKLQSQEEDIHGALNSYGDKSLNADIQALSKVIEEEDQRICEDEVLGDDLRFRIKQDALFDAIRSWIPEINNEIAKVRGIEEAIHATKNEISEIDEELKQYAEYFQTC